VSLVESWPSTLMRSNERFTHTPVSRSSVPAWSAASVWMKQNIVACRGEIIPAPLACAERRTVPAGSRTSRQARLGPASLVRIAREKSSASGPSAAHASLNAPTTFSRGSSVPITPVEATATCSGSRPSSPATAACIASAVSIPRSPSPTFEQPEFAATARNPSSGACFETITGAPRRALVVKRAADTVSAASEATTPTSSPSRLIPAATAAARKPCGSSCPSSSSTCAGRSTQRERKKVAGAALSLIRAPPSPAGRASG
jgi:hypothetical protein